MQHKHTGIAGAVVALAAVAGAVLVVVRRRRLRPAAHNNAVEAGSDAKGPAVHTVSTGDVEAPTSAAKSGASPYTSSSGGATPVLAPGCPAATDCQAGSAGVASTTSTTTSSSGRSQAVSYSGSSGPGSGLRSAAERVPSPLPGATPTAAAAAAAAAGKATAKPALASPSSAAAVAQETSNSSSLNSASLAASVAAAAAAAAAAVAGPPVSRLTPQRKDLHTDARLEMSALGQPTSARGSSTAATPGQEPPTAAAAALADPAAATETAAAGIAVAAAAAVVADASLDAGDGSNQEPSDNVVRLLPLVLGRGAFGEYHHACLSVRACLHGSWVDGIHTHVYIFTHIITLFTFPSLLPLQARCTRACTAAATWQ